MKDKILFIDTETGGLDPSKYSLLSVGLVAWSDFEVVDTLEILINDGRLVVSESALKINKIEISEHKKVAMPSRLAVIRLKEFLKKNFTEGEKITLAGHNVNFDVNFLRVFLAENEENFSTYFSHRFVDTSSILYYLYLAGKIKYKAISSSDAFKLFNINVPLRHTALNDALATAELFTKLISLLKRKLRIDLLEEKTKDQYVLF